ncbi:GAF domain-containing protein [Cystobacter fuscus]
METQREGAPTAEQSLRASNLLLHALTEVQTEFIQGHDTHQLFDKLLLVLLKLTHSEYGFIGEVLFTPEGTPFLRTRAVAHVEWTDTLREFYRRELSTGLEFPHLQKLFGAVMVSGRPVLDNAPCREEFGTRLEGHPPLGSFLGLPFHSPTEMVGMVGLANRPGGFDTGVITFLRPVLATCCAILQGLRNEQRRRRAEDAQRRSAESFRLLIERSPDAILIHRRGTLLFANSAAVRLLGYTSGEQLRAASSRRSCWPGARRCCASPREQWAARGALPPPAGPRGGGRGGDVVARVRRTARGGVHRAGHDRAPPGAAEAARHRAHGVAGHAGGGRGA